MKSSRDRDHELEEFATRDRLSKLLFLFSFFFFLFFFSSTHLADHANPVRRTDFRGLGCTRARVYFRARRGGRRGGGKGSRERGTSKISETSCTAGNADSRSSMTRDRP